MRSLKESLTVNSLNKNQSKPPLPSNREDIPENVGIRNMNFCCFYFCFDFFIELLEEVKGKLPVCICGRTLQFVPSTTISDHLNTISYYDCIRTKDGLGICHECGIEVSPVPKRMSLSKKRMENNIWYCPSGVIHPHWKGYTMCTDCGIESIVNTGYLCNRVSSMHNLLAYIYEKRALDKEWDDIYHQICHERALEFSTLVITQIWTKDNEDIFLPNEICDLIIEYELGRMHSEHNETKDSNDIDVNKIYNNPLWPLIKSTGWNEIRSCLHRQRFEWNYCRSDTLFTTHSAKFNRCNIIRWIHCIILVVLIVFYLSSENKQIKIKRDIIHNMKNKDADTEWSGVNIAYMIGVIVCLIDITVSNYYHFEQCVSNLRMFQELFSRDFLTDTSTKNKLFVSLIHGLVTQDIISLSLPCFNRTISANPKSIQAVTSQSQLILDDVKSSLDELILLNTVKWFLMGIYYLNGLEQNLLRFRIYGKPSSSHVHSSWQIDNNSHSGYFNYLLLVQDLLCIVMWIYAIRVYFRYLRVENPIYFATVDSIPMWAAMLATTSLLVIKNIRLLVPAAEVIVWVLWACLLCG
ncbi:hypothetical protein RFI_23292 [Reticulomyxa filosa]|uniref:Uncharacterized protein n=1 Tax=Reticulomyxa filosa TaxID=46433 RepID=X6MK88_RETFI|nr:hypothetical protein RFI_23292 [Reticulomyxa filosa]|eukprot:ETO14076.1 hypothetical protein RFI_23292 [Reticulomyxa filosa]